MSERERFDRLRLIRSPRIGPVSFRQLITRFGTASEALRAIPDMAARGGGKASVADAATVEREIAASRACGARYLMMGDADYPMLLDQMEGAPPALIVRGDAALSTQPCVAIVGARNASAAACRFARMLAQDLGQRGAVVVSGLARGIDTEAHRGSIDTGTIGVIAVTAHHEIVLGIIGGLFVVEALSVIIQVFFYKRTGKRVFRMAPIHHHFEQLGWAEPTVVIRFWIIAFVLALAGLATLKLR